MVVERIFLKKFLDKNKFMVLDDNYYNGSLYIKNDVYLSLKENEKEKVFNNIKLEKFKKYKDGDKVGENLIYIDDKLILKEDIYVKVKEEKNKKKEGFLKRIISFFKKILVD